MPSSDGHTRGSYASGLARREAILGAAVDLLGEVGYHGIPLHDITRSVGISHPGVIYHFPSKEILLMSIVDRYEKEMGFDFRKLVQLDAVALLDTLLEALSNVATNATIIEAKCMPLTEASSELHPAHDHYERHNRKFHTLLTQAWTELQTQGFTHTALKAHDIAVLQMSLFDGILNQWLYTYEGNCPEQMARFYLGVFTPGATQGSLGHYREAGWLR